MIRRNASELPPPLDFGHGVDSLSGDFITLHGSIMTERAALWPLVLYFAAVIGLVAAMLALSYVLGMRHTGKAAEEPFESGIVSVGSARLRFSAKFYLIAMFFVIFDLEAVYLFAWAIALKDVGWPGYIEVLIFIAILVAALGYLWRIGALEWGARRQRGKPSLGKGAA